jgi:hypothetical protein
LSTFFFRSSLGCLRVCGSLLGYSDSLLTRETAETEDERKEEMEMSHLESWARAGASPPSRPRDFGLARFFHLESLASGDHNLNFDQLRVGKKELPPLVLPKFDPVHHGLLAALLITASGPLKILHSPIHTTGQLVCAKFGGRWGYQKRGWWLSFGGG